MASVKPSTKGQIVIPKEIREAKDWSPGTEFEVILTEAGVLLSTVTTPSDKGARSSWPSGKEGPSASLAGRNRETHW